MEEQSKTIAGSWSSLMDGLQQSAAQVGLQIADALDLTDTFQYFGNILTNFASTVSNSGIAEAFKTCIPVEFQVGLITLGTVILSIAIPAFALLVANTGSLTRRRFTRRSPTSEIMAPKSEKSSPAFSVLTPINSITLATVTPCV